MKDVLVIGAGPGGLAAALAAAEAGAQVSLLDRGAMPGGQYFRQRSAGLAGAVRGRHIDIRLPDRLGRVLRHPRIDYRPGSTVWQISRGEGITVDTGQDRIAGRCVVLATGAYELVLPFPGWDLPGVMTAGAAQALLKGQGLPAGRRVAIAGSGPFLLPVAAGLQRAGSRIAVLAEAVRVRPRPALLRYPGRLREAADYLGALAVHGVRPRLGRALIACHGTGRVETAVVARVDADWRAVPGTEREYAVDAVCVSYGFVPSLELPRALGCRESGAAVWHDGQQQTSVPGVFVAGETTGVGGAVLAEGEGRIAGAGAAARLGLLDGPGYGRACAPARPALASARAFAGLLGSLYPPPGPGWVSWLQDTTTFCRCEEVPWSRIGAALEAGAVDCRAVKALSRCGMGYCQGRMCGTALASAIAARTGRSAVGDLHGRPIAAPVPLGSLARRRSYTA